MSIENPSKESDKKLEEAIREYLHQEGDSEGGILVDFLLITAEHIADEDGTATGLSLVSSENQSIYRTAGLLRYGTKKIDARMLGMGEEQ